MEIKKTTIRTLSRLGQRGAVFGMEFPALGAEIENLKLLTADLSLLSGMERFVNEFPDKFINVGIAEQNMIGIAAGLAMEGACVFATTYASFIAVRSLEQVRQNLAHMRCNVKIIGTSAGVIAAKSGISHWATEDLAFMRALPNIKVFSPADALEAVKIVEYAAHEEGPMYIRLSGGLNCPQIYTEDFDFVPGKAVSVYKEDGKDVAILATGCMVHESLQAAELLEKEGISAAVINFHTIKPLDKEKLDEILERYKLVVTVEEHTITGGLGGAVAEYMSEKIRTARLVRLGFPDCFYPAGSQRYIWSMAGLTGEKIAARIKEELTD